MSLSMAPQSVASAVPLGRPETGLENRAFIQRELQRWSGESRLLMLTVRAPLAVPEVLLQMVDSSYGMLWDPLEGVSQAGIGAAVRIDVSGANRFAEVRERAATLWPQLAQVAEPSISRTLTPRLFGGFAFDVGAADAAPWNELGDASFTLPRFLYTRHANDASLSITLSGEELSRPGAPEKWLGRIEAILLALAMSSVLDEQAAETQILHVDEPDAESWYAQIDSIRGLIAAGHFEKIVAARRSRVELASALGTAQVLQRLGRGLRASTRFAFCREQSAFLGATPERLVSLKGRQIETEALAGTLECGAEQAAQLLASGKDLREHQLVVDAIVRRLAPLCAELTIPEGPEIRELREVLHLCTPLCGKLDAPRHVLELAEALHPTPAVGGVPTVDAMRWIADNEPDARGWYAAPVGWFDAQGDGEFAVALRSAVLRGKEAWLYAGAGIVRGSDPELELSETVLKRRTLLRALGAR